jgi:hypothetical protein
MSSQSDLEISANANRLYELLHRGLTTGEITELKPISGKDIARRASRALNQEFESIHVREWVHHLRANLKLPIGSNGDGYFLCTFKSQWVKTQKALIARIKNQRDAAYGPDEFYNKAEQQTLFHPPDRKTDINPAMTGGDIENHPVVQALKDNFGAVPI